MKTKFILFCSCLFIVTASMAQPKPKKKPPSRQGVESSKEIRKLLDELYSKSLLVGVTNPDCDPIKHVLFDTRYAKNFVDQDYLPRKWALGRIIDAFFANPHYNFHIHKSFSNSQTLNEFTETYYSRKLDKLSESEKTRAKKFYDDLKSLGTEGLQIDKKTFKDKLCVVNVDTKLVLTSISNHKPTNKNRPEFSKFFWDLKSTINIKCDCTKKNKTALKSGTLEFTGNLQTEVAYTPGKRFLTSKQSKPNFQYKVLEAICCPKEVPETEDGSFIDPSNDEPISFPNQFLEVGAGIGTAKDEETELCASVGFMHNLFSEEENSALFIGARAKVNNASFSGSDFSQTTINIGPSVEHQTIIGNTDTKWINGVNGAFVFGSQDSAGFKTDISGFNIGLYTGVEVALGNNLALGVMATLVEYNSQTFKTDEGEFKSNSTGLNLNKGSVGLSLRIDLDNNN